MDFAGVFFIMAAAGAGIWYFFYRLGARSDMERWERGIGEMPDLKTRRMVYIVTWGIVQIIVLKFLETLANFPAQR